jgi:hypothetical protein
MQHHAGWLAREQCYQRGAVAETQELTATDVPWEDELFPKVPPGATRTFKADLPELKRSWVDVRLRDHVRAYTG